MSSGTRRGTGVVAARGTSTIADRATIAGLAAGEGAIEVERAATGVRVFNGVEAAGGVVVDDERLWVAEGMDWAGSGDVDTGETGVAAELPGVLAPPLTPAQPATTIERTARPAMERPADQRTRVTTTHASEPTDIERSTFDMMAS